MFTVDPNDVAKFLHISKEIDEAATPPSALKIMKEPQLIQLSEQWHTWRQKSLTGSDIACIIPYTEKYIAYYADLYNLQLTYNAGNTCYPSMTKSEYFLQKSEDPSARKQWSSFATDMGHMYEPALRNAIAQELDCVIFTPGGLISKRHPLIGGSPDGILMFDGHKSTIDTSIYSQETQTLEIKTIVSRKMQKYPPLYYFLQAEYVAWCCGMKKAIYAEGNPIQMDEQVWQSEDDNLIDKKHFKYGIILAKTEEKDKKLRYVYPDQFIKTKEEFVDWKERQIVNNPSMKYTVIYYKIEALDILQIRVRPDYTETFLPLFLETLFQIQNLKKNSTAKSILQKQVEDAKESRRRKKNVTLSEIMLYKTYLGKRSLS